ncbi:MAG: class I SAM-dependent methyltransferase [Pseudomonadota bacterium]
MTVPDPTTCPACQSTDATPLPVPHATRAMISDGQIVGKSLSKMSCEVCGHGFHQMPLTKDALRGFYDDDYSLGQNDQRAEEQRAAAYGAVLAGLLDQTGIPAPTRFLEFGCGMGSLLAWLKRRWGSDAAFGIEPSAQLASFAAKIVPDGVSVEQGFAEDIVATHLGAYDLCLSVNVVEHTLSPEAFLDTCAKVIRPEGAVIVICPDGETPSSELLFFDHVSSFTQSSLSAFANRARLHCVTRQALTGPLQGFQMMLLKPGADPSLAPKGTPGLSARRAAFLDVWRGAEDAIKSRLNGQPYAIFGVGEYADLLAAYAPGLVEDAVCFVVDTPQMQTHKGKTVLTTDAFLRTTPTAILAAVHERSWPAVEARFRGTCPDVLHPAYLTSNEAAQ